jgi:hypothetical protein
MVEVKDLEPNLDLESDPENIENRHIINANPIATITTTTIQPEEPVDPEEGEHLFYSQMWMKGTLLHSLLIMVARKSSSQLSSSNSWGCQQHHTYSHTTSSGFTRDNISMSTSSVSYPMASIPSRMR